MEIVEHGHESVRLLDCAEDLDDPFCSIKAASEERVLLIRHGQSKYNRAPVALRLLSSYVDAELTERGIKDAEQIAPLVAKFNPNLIVSSPLRRARETTKIISRGISARFDVWRVHSEWMISPVDFSLHFDPVTAHHLSRSCDLNVADEVDQIPQMRIGYLWRRLNYHQARQLKKMGVRRETEVELLSRVLSFGRSISRCREKRIAVVGHGRFFSRILGGYHLKNGEAALFPKRLFELPEILLSPEDREKLILNNKYSGELEVLSA